MALYESKPGDIEDPTMNAFMKGMEAIWVEETVVDRGTIISYYRLLGTSVRGGSYDPVSFKAWSDCRDILRGSMNFNIASHALSAI